MNKKKLQQIWTDFFFLNFQIFFGKKFRKLLIKQTEATGGVNSGGKKSYNCWWITKVSSKKKYMKSIIASHYSLCSLRKYEYREHKEIAERKKDI